MTARNALLLTMVLATGAATPLAAQTAASSFGDMTGRLKPGQMVSVYVQTQQADPTRAELIRGRVLALSEQTLELRMRGHPREVAERDVRVICERFKKKGKAALIGLSIGAAIGLANLARWCHAQRDSDSCANATGVLLTWPGLSAALGAGSISRSRWNERHRYESLSIDPVGPRRARRRCV